MNAALSSGILSGAIVFAMLSVACWLLSGRASGRPSPSRAGTTGSDGVPAGVGRARAAPRRGGLTDRVRRRGRGDRGALDADSMVPALVRQMAALLQAGRSRQALWTDTVQAWRMVLDRDATASGGRPDDAVLPVLEATERAASLGHSVSTALRAAARPEPGPARVWLDLADCWDVAERSGAPLAGILNRYADQLESDHDADAARRTAMAGPGATVRLLNWLPVFGLGLALVMGINPFAILLGTGIGWCALGAGTVLMVVGRRWTRAMVAAAAGPAR